MIWQLRRETWQLPEDGAIMGILNVTPDSFSDGGQHNDPAAAYERGCRLIAEGADIVDIGGESTRPGATEVDTAEEIARVLPVIKSLRREFPSLRISIDTRHPEVAIAAIEAGADIINDITGMGNPAMRQVAAQSGCGVILMHMQGTPDNMQLAPRYSNVVRDVSQFFVRRLEACIHDGINPACVCLDPGLGFGKSIAHNLRLIAGLPRLRNNPLLREQPLMMALSRKRFMAAVLLDDDMNYSTMPTLTMSLLSAERGANIHRVHEPLPLRQALSLRNALSDPDKY